MLKRNFGVFGKFEKKVLIRQIYKVLMRQISSSYFDITSNFWNILCSRPKPFLRVDLFIKMFYLHSWNPKQALTLLGRYYLPSIKNFIVWFFQSYELYVIWPTSICLFYVNLEILRCSALDFSCPDLYHSNSS